MSPTTVLIDGYDLAHGSARRGIGTYLARLIRGLVEEPHLSVRVLSDPSVSLPAGAEMVPLRRHAPARWRSLEHDWRLPSSIAGAPADVFLSPAQHPPRASVIPWVQTVHDLIPLTRPHPLVERDRRRWLKVGPRLHEASAVIAISTFSAEQAVTHLKLDPAAVKVIPQGVDSDVFCAEGTRREGAPYLLHVAAWGPHKGFAEAFEVVARLAESGLPHRLVLAGPGDAWMNGQIQAAIRASPRPDLIDLAGYVDDLPAAYRGATALLMTSRCEGFGLPVLEAMACGTPVVAFANSSLPEVVGDAGVLVPDGDVGAMAEALTRIIAHEPLRADLSRRGIARAALFPWETTIAAYGELLRAVAS